MVYVSPILFSETALLATHQMNELQEQAKKAILQESFFRWESAVLISLTLLLSVLSVVLSKYIPGSPAMWLFGGLLAEAALVFSSLKDPEFGQQVVADLLAQEFRPDHLKDKKLQSQIKIALDYRSRIDAGIREQNDSMLKDELTNMASQIDEWLENIYGLAKWIDRHQQENKIMSRDRRRAVKRIKELGEQLVLETDTAVKFQLKRNLTAKQQQIDTIDRRDNNLERARLQLENSLTHLGTIYSQTMLVGARDIDNGRSRRLRQSINDEVVELNDILLSMDEVYAEELG